MSRLMQNRMSPTKTVKWKTIVALLLLLAATLLNWSWIWGIFFLLWTAVDLIQQETHFVERITRNDDPMLYWIIVCTWIVLSLFSFLM